MASEAHSSSEARSKPLLQRWLTTIREGNCPDFVRDAVKELDLNGESGAGLSAKAKLAACSTLLHKHLLHVAVEVNNVKAARALLAFGADAVSVCGGYCYLYCSDPF